MEMPFTTKRLLVLRKLTRAISDLLRGQLKAHLTTMSPVLRPRSVFGEHVQSGTKEVVRGADKAFKDLQAEYEAVAGLKPFGLTRGLTSPFEVESATPEMLPIEYLHTAKTGKETKRVSVMKPLKWVLYFSGYSPNRLRDLLNDRNRTTDDVHRFVLHYLLMHAVFANQPGILQILEEVRFPVKFEKWPEFGGLPITCVGSTISTILPPDEVIIESTEISGADAFEEIVQIGDITKMKDAVRDQLLELVASHDPALLE
jgi:hypothetical protein